MSSMPAQRYPDPSDDTRRMTMDEYWRFDVDGGEFKWEYRNGVAVCMAGGTERHALITYNVGLALGKRLGDDGACRPYSPDLRIGVPRKPFTMYPDVPVVCGPSEYDPRDPDGRTIFNPRLVVEVLSPSTEAYDRGKKFQRYMAIPAFQEYVLVTQDRPRVEALYRQPDGTWSLAYADAIGGVVRLRSLDVDLPLAEVYRFVIFPPTDEDGEPAPTP